MRLRVMTYNIRWGMGSDGRFSLERIADVIRDVDADVVGLQEVERGSLRSRCLDAPAMLAQRLEMHVAFGANLRLGTWQFGNALLSRFPIRSWENVPLPVNRYAEEPCGHELSGRRGGARDGSRPLAARYHRVTATRFLRNRFPALFDRRGLLVGTLALPSETTLRCAVTHLPLNYALRREHADAILARLQERCEPTLLLGDLNEGERGLAVTRFRESGYLTNLSGDADTFPSEDPARKIDFILATADLRAVDAARVIPSPASDHLPVVVDLELVESRLTVPR